MRIRCPLHITATLLLVSAACSDSGDSGSPTGPGDPPPPSSQVDSVSVTPGQVPLEVEETVELSAEVFDESGEPLTDVEVVWSSTDTEVASVDDSGEVTGQAKGRTSITASAEEVSDNAAVRVRTGETAAIDSTEMTLVSDSSERAEGTFRFDVETGAAPDIEEGDIIVGAEGGGYLRRVTDVVTLTSAEAEVETEQAALAEALESGSFQETFQVAPGASSDAVGRDDVFIGPTRPVGFSSSVTIDDGALILEDHELASGEVCFDDDDGEACATVSLTLPSGRIAFGPDMDVGVTLGFFSIEEFHAIAEGELEFDVTAELSSSGEIQFADERPLDNGFFRTPFTVIVNGIPVTGEIRLEFFVGYEVAMAAEGSVDSGFDSDLTTTVGARYDDGAWSDVFETIPSFEPEPVDLDLEGGANARVWVKPQVSIFFYSTAGPTTFLEPFLEGDATFADQCFFDLTSGLDAGLGFEVEILSLELASFEKSLTLGTETLLTEALPCGSVPTPSATIEAPADGSTFEEGASVTFEGSADDPEDGPLTGDALVWTSDLDGELGTGTSVTTASLSSGTHQITLTATNSAGAADTDQITVTVTGDNSPPSATIEAPADGSTFEEGASVTFEGSADDPEDGPLTGDALVWTSDLDGELGTGTSVTTASLSSGTHQITLTATDSDGATDTDQITIGVESTANTPPSATIDAPADGASFEEGASVTFEGSADDPEDGPLTGDALVWTSDLDGDLGTGTSVTTASFSSGTHQITLTATDSDGATGTDQITITIEDSGGGPASITPGDTVSGTIDPPGEVDEFTFEGEAGQEVAAFLQGLTGDFTDDFELRLLDRAGTADETVLGEMARGRGDNETLTDGSSAQSTGRVTLPRTATYTVRVEGGNSTDDSGDYRFLLHPVDRAPENRSASITPGDTIDNVELEPPADIDEFTFEGEAGQEVAAFLQGLTGDFTDDFELRLLDRAGTADETVLGEVARGRGDNETLTDGTSAQSTGRVTLPRTATYTVRVEGGNTTDDSGDYRFLLRDESGG